MGRKPKLTRTRRARRSAAATSGEAVREIARSYNVSDSTISRLTDLTQPKTPVR